MKNKKTRDVCSTVTIRVPISIRQRGGRKMVLLPQGSAITPVTSDRQIDNAMVKAIARGFRWREMLENGTHATIAEIAQAEKINESYVGRVLRLTLLAPSIVEAILARRQPIEMTLPALMQPLPIVWGEQANRIFGRSSGRVAMGYAAFDKRTGRPMFCF
jgi:hypothetical protein